MSTEWGMGFLFGFSSPTDTSSRVGGSTAVHTHVTSGGGSTFRTGGSTAVHTHVTSGGSLNHRSGGSTAVHTHVTTGGGSRPRTGGSTAVHTHVTSGGGSRPGSTSRTGGSIAVHTHVTSGGGSRPGSISRTGGSSFKVFHVTSGSGYRGNPVVVGAPPPTVLEAILGPTTRIIRRVDIYEQDGITEFVMNAKILGGTVSVDQTRDERRNLDLELLNFNGELNTGPGLFWYDKVIKVFRGAVSSQGVEWTTQIGEFQIDRITKAHHPDQVLKVTGRDYTKKLLNSLFRYTTLYPSTSTLEAAVQAIAFAAGVRKFDLPTTGIVLDIDVIFEAGTSRWEAIKQICIAKSYEPFFRPDGRLAIRPYSDPSTTFPTFTFGSGPSGVLVSYDQEANDSRLRNVLVVSGESTDTIPVTAIAANHKAGSPTSVEEIGERVERITSSLIVTEQQAQTLANHLLKIAALEEYSINFASMVLPWLDVGSIIDIPDIDNGSAYYSTRYLLSSLTIPLGLGAMSGNGRRVVLV